MGGGEGKDIICLVAGLEDFKYEYSDRMYFTGLCWLYSWAQYSHLEYDAMVFVQFYIDCAIIIS